MDGKNKQNSRDLIMAAHFVGHAQRSFEQVKQSLDYALRNCPDLNISEKFIHMQKCVETLAEGITEAREEINSKLHRSMPREQKENPSLEG